MVGAIFLSLLLLSALLEITASPLLIVAAGIWEIEGPSRDGLFASHRPQLQLILRSIALPLEPVAFLLKNLLSKMTKDIGWN